MTAAATTPVVRIQRTIAAAPERVFDAWLDAKALATFMRPGPPGTTCDVVNDPRVGGRYLITMQGDNVYPHTGEYLVIDRPRKLVFTWYSKGTAMAETKVTIELKLAKGGATDFTLTHVGLSEASAAQHSQGWTMIADLLEGTLTK